MPGIAALSVWHGCWVDSSGPLDALASSGVGRGDLVSLVVKAGVGIAIAANDGAWSFAATDPCAPGGLGRGPDTGAPGGLGIRGGLGANPALPVLSAIASVETSLRPRWVLWSADTSLVLAQAGIRLGLAWDLAAVHRLLSGGWLADPGLVWAAAHGLPLQGIPAARPIDLFAALDDTTGGDPEDPLQQDGYLRADWAAGAWGDSPQRLARWAMLALDVAARQSTRVDGIPRRPAAPVTARSESGAELLCAEMSVDGLPVDRASAESVIARYIGPRPRDDTEAEAMRAARHADVLRHVAAGFSVEVDLGSHAQVKALLGRLGIHVTDTRAQRLREVADRHPVVGALLAWRKAERIASTYGYRWLDEHLGDDGRLRGQWSATDGASGRMTASSGLHSIPAELREAVAAEAGMAFVRADLGQIEPRVLAFVSGDPALAAATSQDDMYAPVAAQLDVDRATAKTAMLGAMYGATTGRGAQALRRLNAAYPVAMAYLDGAARQAQAGQDLRTYGGRLIPMRSGTQPDATTPEPPGAAAARGRYGRNALIQGAAAELFKMWAVTVRARIAALDAHIVLCLHDELLIHTPEQAAATVAELTASGLNEAVQRWAPATPVRFLADIALLGRWSDAKNPKP